jgi:hypothetical protein
MSEKKEKIKKLNEKISKLNDFFEKYRKQSGIQVSPPIPRINEKAEMITLLNIAEKTRSALKKSGRELAALSFKNAKAIEETKMMLDFVDRNKKWKDPYLEVNLLLEWAIYRAFWALEGRIPEGFGPILNWDGSEPIHTSSGLQPDLLVDFESYYLIVESTISSGPRQYDTEAEPVIRHIARIIRENKEKGDSRPVYSFFIARELDPNVIEYFFVYHAYHKHPLAQEYITVVPLTVSQFSLIFGNLVKENVPKEKIFCVFEEIQKIKGLRICKECGVPNLDANSWYEQVLKIIAGHGLLAQS